MPVSSILTAHSADVRIRLELGDMEYPVAQLGPDFVILEQPAEHPSAHATLHLRVDAHAERWTVFLPDGLRHDSRRAAISRA